MLKYFLAIFMENENFNHLLNNFLKTINARWSKDLKIRFVYRELAPFFQRDLNFFYSSLESQLEQYQNGFLLKGNEVVCKTICMYYHRVLKKLYIESKIIVTNVKEIPHYALIVSGDFGWYYIDPLKDLMANQLGLFGKFFGIIPKYGIVSLNYPFLIHLSTSYVESLDNQLYQGGFLDDFFEQLHLELSNDHLIRKFCNNFLMSRFDIILFKIQFMNDYLINLGTILGSYERVQYYWHLISCIFNKIEQKSLIVSGDLHGTIIFEVNYLPKNQFVKFEEIQNEASEFVLKRIC